MTTGHVFAATSLDGFIARKDHALDWLPQENAEGEDLGYETFVSSVDGLIMGRGTFEKVLTFGDWPYEKPVIVFSKTLTQDAIPDKLEGKVRLSHLSPGEIMESLNKEGWKRVYVDGGLVVQSFIQAGLIEGKCSRRLAKSPAPVRALPLPEPRVGTTHVVYSPSHIYLKINNLS